MSSENSLPTYATFIDALKRSSTASDISALLDGQAAADLRRLVPLADRRRLGAFFTPHDLAEALVAPLEDLSTNARIVDTSCGAGDLLLAAQRATAESARGRQLDISFIGRDLVPEFTEATRLRLRLQSHALKLAPTIQVRIGDALRTRVAKTATHLLLNPPFAAMAAPKECTWSSGSVNSAAVILASHVEAAPRGVSVRALLPDVLRSGARYRAWRRHIESRLDLISTTPMGRFDRWTDVHVFMLSGVVRDARGESGKSPTNGIWTTASREGSVGALFDISVGSVVHYRAPHSGPVRPYLTARGFGAWAEIERISTTRRFSGRVHTPPFVAVPRTSRPGDTHRARGALVTGTRQVAVDNHLLVASPRDGQAATCWALLRQLQRPSTSIWLDDAIQCRHLTVGALASVPWEGTE